MSEGQWIGKGVQNLQLTVTNADFGGEVSSADHSTSCTYGMTDNRSESHDGDALQEV